MNLGPGQSRSIKTLDASILVRNEPGAGSTGPMVARHAEVAAAREYSGRTVDDK